MRDRNFIRYGVLLASILAVPSLRVATTSKSDYSAGVTDGRTHYSSGMTACDSRSVHGKDLCAQGGKEIEAQARADLAFGFSGKGVNHKQLRVTKANSAYDVGKPKYIRD